MMRLATYNVEWFNDLFDRHDRLLVDDAPSGRYGVTRADQAHAAAYVLQQVNADAVLIVEAPDASARRSTVDALENFATAFSLRTSRACMGFANDTRQEIALLYDPDQLEVRHAPRPGDHNVPRFDGTFEIDLDIDARLDRVRFSKPPLELDVQTATGTQFHLIGAHLKSKAPHGARSDADVMRIAIANRRKQLAQAIWLRARVDQLLSDDTPLIVMGDLNDGPGLDVFEGLFGRSSVEIIMGADGPAPLHDPHAVVSPGKAAASSARFWMHTEEEYLEALLDYIMVSRKLRAQASGWRIWHPFADPEAVAIPNMSKALLAASDHFPVSVDLAI